MSLINDVLRDLERRQNSPSPGPIAGHRPMPAAPARQPGSRWPWWLAAAVLAGAILHWTLATAPPLGNPADRPETLTAQVTSERPAAPSQQASPVLPEPSQPEPLPEPAIDQPPEALATEPSVATERTPIDEPTPIDESAVALVPETGESGERLAAPTAQREPVSDPPETRAPPETEPGPPAPATPRQQEQIAIERVDGSSDDRHDELLSARRALARGQLDVGERRLRDLVERHPDYDDARLELARYLVEHRRSASAIATLQGGLDQAGQPQRLAALLGRMLLESGRTAAAIDTLARYAPDIEADPDYHQVLATAYRQAGNHEAAADHFGQLAEVDPARAAAWIGLGASLEALDELERARQAYRQALDAGDIRAARFARQRLQALGPSTPDSSGE